MVSLSLILLLRLSWLAAILPLFLASLLPPLRHLILLFAGRGKTLRPSPFTLPQRFFLHFYVLALALTTCLMLCTWFYAFNETRPHVPEVEMGIGLSAVASHLTGGARIDFEGYRKRVGSEEWRTVFLLVMMEMQVLRRLYETRVVFDYGSEARMHVLGYLTGLL